ncbi:MAG TPA: hypothetical protein PLM52_07710, partial [Tabrizicola sp.]|nr:hypothetical protein [Tabrizicola sp.]
PGTFSYLPNLYLTNRGAQLAGVWMYGYNKRMGKLAMGNADYSVRAPDDTPIWSARYQQKGFARPLSDSPQQGLVQSICNQVVVSQGKLSKWQFSAFDFNLGSAAIAPVSAEIDIWNQDLADLPQGRLTARPLAMPGSPTQDAPGLPGAFRIRTSWTLSNPFDSRRIARLEGARTALP